MKLSSAMKVFVKEHPYIGPIAWVASIQYFVIQLLVAHDWAKPYSIAHNTISDLGNTVCGTYGGNYVCSPLHNLMNVSFILLGIGMIVGSKLLYQAINKSRAMVIGFSYMAIAGIGTIIVGLFPENTTSGLHTYGAALPFFVGNIGLVVLGFNLVVPRLLRIYTVFSGIIALCALVLFITNDYLGIGAGGMERLTAYPQTIWLIIFGIYMIKPKGFLKSSSI